MSDLHGSTGCRASRSFHEGDEMQFGLRSLFLVIANICILVAAMAAFGRLGGGLALGLFGYLVVVFRRQEPVLQRATVLAFGILGAALIVRGLPAVMRDTYSPFMGLPPYDTLMLGTAYLVGALFAYRLFIASPPPENRQD